MSEQFLDLLYRGAAQDAYDAVLASAVESGSTGPELDRLREQHAVALRVREQMERHRQREAELSALYETANDLTAIRDVDAVLSAIVRRARSLLHADMTYLSLNDEADRASYMKVTDGALTAEFRRLRLPLGTGLLGLVAQTGEPYYTEDYQADQRFVHRDFIDSAVAGEDIRAILGVPLMLGGKVTGALLAVHRSVRRFPPAEVALLMSFAAHASVALENARLFEEIDRANRQVRAQAAAVEVAAQAHDRLTDVLLHGGGVGGVAEVVADVLRGSVTVLDHDGHPLVGQPGNLPGQLVRAGLDAAIREARASGRSVAVDSGDVPSYVAVALAGSEHLGTLVLHGLSADLGLADRRTLERGALVTALVLLFGRSVAEAEDRVRGELLGDLIDGRDLDGSRLRERARRQHVELDGPTVVVVARVDGVERHRSAQVAGRLASELAGLAGEYDGRIVLLAPQTEEPLRVGHLLHDRLMGAGARPTVGLAHAATYAAIGAAYGEARRCVEALVTLGRLGEVSDPAGLGVARLLLGHNGPAELEAFVERLIGPLLGYDRERGTELADTLDAWFATGCRSVETARRLQVHVNTVAQRLERVATLLGGELREPTRALDLQVALRLRRLRAVGPVDGPHLPT